MTTKLEEIVVDAYPRHAQHLIECSCNPLLGGCAGRLIRDVQVRPCLFRWGRSPTHFAFGKSYPDYLEDLNEFHGEYPFRRAR